MPKVLASYLVRVTLHERADDAEIEAKAPDAPTIDELERTVKQALYDRLPYFGNDDIGVSAERTDV